MYGDEVGDERWIDSVVDDGEVDDDVDVSEVDNNVLIIDFFMRRNWPTFGSGWSSGGSSASGQIVPNSGRSCIGQSS